MYYCIAEKKNKTEWIPGMTVEVYIIVNTYIIEQNTVKSKTNLTLKVLNFWKCTSCCSLKPLRSGMGEVVPARTSPTLHPPSPLTVHQLTSTLRVNCFINWDMFQMF